MDVLKKERGQLRRMVTKYHTEMFSDANPGCDITLLYGKLDIKFKQLEVVNEKILAIMLSSATEDELTDLYDDNDIYETKVLECKRRFEQTKHVLTPVGPATYAGNKRHFKLPHIEMKTFSGELKDWLGYWGQFCKIDEDNELVDADKFQYLLQTTTGRAREIVESYPPSGPNYKRAISDLKERFARPECLIELYVRELLSLVLNNSKNYSIAHLYTKIETQLRALETLGVASEKYAAMLYPLVESTLPEETNIIWQRSRSGGTLATNLENLMAFLKIEVESEERVLLSKQSFGLQVSPRILVNKDDEGPATAAALPNADRPAKHTGKSMRPKLSCIFCKGSHFSDACFTIRDKSLDEKKALVLKANGCFICLRGGHQARMCRSRRECLICRRQHHVILCPDLDRNSLSRQPNEADKRNSVTSIAVAAHKTILQTLIVNAVFREKNKNCRIMLDTGSQRSYILSKVALELSASKGGSCVLVHSLFGGIKTEEKAHNTYQIKLCNLNNDFRIEVVLLEEKSIVSQVPRIDLTDELPELRNSGIVLSDVGQGCPEIEILLGADCISKILTGKIVHIRGMVAIETLLGWTLMGNLKKAFYDVNTVCLNNVGLCELWDLETIGIKDPIESKNKQKIQAEVLHDFNNSVFINKEGRYEISLPWSEEMPYLDNNRTIVEKRLLNTTKRLRAGGNFEQYDIILKNWLKDGIIEVVNTDAAVTVLPYYLPHRPVYKQSRTTPIRPVFDAGCQGPNGVSLNECLITGINLIELIPTILTRFRQGKIGVASDIRKAFLQISINEKDRDKLRFLWWDGSRIIEYRHTRLVFGLTCSPFVLAAVLNYHTSNPPIGLKDCARKLMSSFYCDNVVISMNTKIEVEEFKANATSLMSLAKFELQEWVDSSQDGGDKGCVTLLGLKWDTATDELFCDVGTSDINSELVVTKRKMLSLVQKIYDPLGLLSAVMLVPKLLLRECFKLKCHWDKVLPDEIVIKFRQWALELTTLGQVRLNRHFGSMESNEVSLHIFCDASITAYSACAFLHIGTINEVKFVMCKSRLAPVNRVGNIPRLELLGACIGARLGEYVKSALNLNKKVKLFYWTDSMIVFYWVQNNHQKSVFVRNRVKEILSLTTSNQWFHIKGKDNPADLPSRGCLPEIYLKTKWWLGPTWLRGNWSVDQNPEVLLDCPEITLITVQEEPHRFFRYLSSFNKTVCLMAWILRFITCLRNKSRISGNLTPEEIEVAKIKVLTIVQTESTSEFNKVDIITDSNGLLRVKTKIIEGNFEENFRYPILLPSKHKVVHMLVRDYHTRFGHAGVLTLIVKLRENFWICKSRRLVRKVTNQCIRCKRYKVKSFQVKNAPLPLDRIKVCKIFETSGVDLCGPLFLKDGQKYWVVLFTCAVFRGVHLELTPSLSTEAFILVLRRFLARRGQVRKLYSDNGTNMVGLSNMFKSVDVNTIESAFELEWQFIVPGAPWWGGWWERLIRMLKDLLKRNLGNARLCYEELSTLICECESFINARPLTYVSETPDLLPITPAMFMQDLGSVNAEKLDLVDKHHIRSNLKHMQVIRNALRNRFEKEYLSQLVHVRKNKSFSPIKVGDIVLIGADNTKRSTWPLGKVLKIYPGRDGETRVADVKVRNGVLTRAIQKLFPLELHAESEPIVERVQSGDIPPVRDPPGSVHNEFNKSTTTKTGRLIKPPQKLNL